MSGMDEAPWMHRRDQFDLILGRAATLLDYVGCAETVLLPEAYCLGSERGRATYISPEGFLHLLGSRKLEGVLDALRVEAYRDGELQSPELLRLLARIGTPSLWMSVDASGRREVEHWPEPDGKATRNDLLYSYLLAKLVYLELKATLQDRPVTSGDLASFTHAASALVAFENVPANSAADAKSQLLKCWQECLYDRSGVIPESRHPLLSRCWSLITSLLRASHRR